MSECTGSHAAYTLISHGVREDVQSRWNVQGVVEEDVWLGSGVACVSVYMGCQTPCIMCGSVVPVGLQDVFFPV